MKKLTTISFLIIVVAASISSAQNLKAYGGSSDHYLDQFDDRYYEGTAVIKTLEPESVAHLFTDGSGRCVVSIRSRLVGMKLLDVRNTRYGDVKESLSVGQYYTDFEESQQSDTTVRFSGRSDKWYQAWTDRGSITVDKVQNVPVSASFKLVEPFYRQGTVRVTASCENLKEISAQQIK